MRSGREHWAWMVVVEVRQGAGGEETRRGDEERRRGEEEEEQATDIKSNNPHLAGGEIRTRTATTTTTTTTTITICKIAKTTPNIGGFFLGLSVYSSEIHHFLILIIKPSP